MLLNENEIIIVASKTDHNLQNLDIVNATKINPKTKMCYIGVYYRLNVKTWNHLLII